MKAAVRLAFPERNESRATLSSGASGRRNSHRASPVSQPLVVAEAVVATAENV